MSRTRTVLTITAMLMASIGVRGAASKPHFAGHKDTPLVRVGVVYNKDLEEKKASFLNIVSTIAKARNLKFDFRVSVGTYDDVVEWYTRGQVDVAILSPGSVARMLRSRLDTDFVIEDHYVATYGIRPGANTFASPRRIAGTGDYPYKYQTVCLTGKEASRRYHLNSLDDIKRLTSEDSKKVRFLLVHPMSASGSIAPKSILKRNGINTDNIEVEWTYNPTLSLELLLKYDGELSREPGGKATVVFVTDETALDGTQASKVNRITLPEPEDYWIPQDAVLCRPELTLNTRKNIKQFFDIELKERGLYFRPVSSAPADYARVATWLGEIEKPTTEVDRTGLQAMAIDQIAALLRNYKELHKETPHKEATNPLRLALVLSGGGAKCAYQLGAIEEIQKTLSAYGVDIDLVVGTSGGAINALTVALDVAGNRAGPTSPRETWTRFKQSDFLHPRQEVNILIGVFLGGIEALIIVWAALLLDQRRAQWWKRHEWWIPVSGVAGLIALVETPLGYFEITPPGLSCLLNHTSEHLWTMILPSLLWAGPTLFALGFIVFTIGWTLSSRDLRFSDNADKKTLRGARQLYVYSRWTLSVTVILLVIFSKLASNKVLSSAESLFDSAGIQRALVEGIPALLPEKITLRAVHGIDAKLKDVSSQIMDGRLLKRDLVITGSRLSKHSKSNVYDPADRYFYYDYPVKKSSSSSNANDSNDPEVPKQDKRFVPFTQYPTSLLDVVVGSSSIYPLFEAHEVKDLSMKLIDGGFVHNSPIEAAMLWRATHIIVIEVSPDVEREDSPSSLLSKFSLAIDYLYDQAQAADVRSRHSQQVEIFTLKPIGPEELDAMDFGRENVQKAIDRGSRDASNQDNPRFERARGPKVEDTLISISSQKRR